jgi:hypothetical protein
VAYKFKHYARPVDNNARNNFEGLLIELSIGLICAGFAYFTYNEIVVLFISTALIAVVCFLLTIHNIYLMIQNYRAARNISKMKAAGKADD